jgi:hypothetical protein
MTVIQSSQNVAFLSKLAALAPEIPDNDFVQLWETHIVNSHSAPN